MNEIEEFLLAMFGEDATEIAKHPDNEDDGYDWDLVATGETNYPCFEYLRIGKKRALAELDLKKQLLAEHPHTTLRQHHGEATLRNMYGPHWEKRLTHLDELYCTTCHIDDGVIENVDGKPCLTVRLLASLYATRPGFKEEWRP